MSIDTFTHFVKTFPKSLESRWSHDSLVSIARSEIEEAIFGKNKTLLKADQLSLWTKWFLEGLAAPISFIEEKYTKFHVFGAVFKSIKIMFPNDDAIAQKELSEAISDHLYIEVERLRVINKRDKANSETRKILIEASLTPRCYLCGYAFTKEAIDQFLKVKGRDPIKLPDLVDIFRPRGLFDRDLQVEIEHVVPVAQGGHGQDNLRLACGWCNKHKGAKLSIYDAHSLPSKANYSIDGKNLNELPEPFWAIRMLAIHNRCQHSEGCTNSTKTHEIYITLRDMNGSPNPTNIHFYCSTHDPISTKRFIGRKEADRIWREKRKA
jgi:hypothetical protein